jgi:hypothetical protein
MRRQPGQFGFAEIVLGEQKLASNLRFQSGLALRKSGGMRGRVVSSTPPAVHRQLAAQHL